MIDKKIDSLQELIRIKYEKFISKEDRYMSEHADFYDEINDILKKLKILMNPNDYKEYKEILWENGVIG